MRLLEPARATVFVADYPELTIDVDPCHEAVVLPVESRRRTTAFSNTMIPTPVKKTALPSHQLRFAAKFAASASRTNAPQTKIAAHPLLSVPAHGVVHSPEF